MTFKNFQWRIAFRVMLLFISLTIAAFLVVSQLWIFVFLMAPLLVYLVVEFYKFHYKAHEELNQFVESVHYRDFSRNFDVKHAPLELQPLRKGFNDINTTFKIISKEKETQYHYLQKIMELVDTGILSYKELDGKVVWMNETLKKMLQLPYLNTIHSLARRDGELYKQIMALRSGETKIATAHLEKTSFKILISSSVFYTDEERFTLIAFQNIDEAIDETESKAWQKLLGVMTHEIMNSIAPISSLADTLKNRLQLSIHQLDNSNGCIDDLEIGIETIKRRSEGLLKFAETYRNLNKITTLNLQKVCVRNLFENLHQLMQPTLDQKGIEMEVVLKNTDVELEADINLVEQVLINLVVNSIEAVRESEDPRIVLSAFKDNNSKVVIRVSDNGSGMSEEVLEKVFIPFFSTRKSGSGIGLSLCKQIMMLHRGNIQIQSAEGKGSSFSLYF